MKILKSILTTLALSCGVVITAAFTGKPCAMVDFLYNNPSGQTLIEPGVPGCSIIPAELNCDYDVDGYPDSWTPGSLAGHTTGAYFMGIEFNSFELSLQEAANTIYGYYYQYRTLPADGACLVSVYGYHYIFIFRTV